MCWSGLTRNLKLVCYLFSSSLYYLLCPLPSNLTTPFPSHHPSPPSFSPLTHTTTEDAEAVLAWSQAHPYLNVVGTEVPDSIFDGTLLFISLISYFFLTILLHFIPFSSFYFISF